MFGYEDERESTWQGFNQVSAKAESRLATVKEVVADHEFDQGNEVLELDSTDHHLVDACWAKFSKWAREDRELLVKRIKMTPEEIALLPQSKKRKVMYKVAVSNDKEALKAWITVNKA